MYYFVFPKDGLLWKAYCNFFAHEIYPFFDLKWKKTTEPASAYRSSPCIRQAWQYKKALKIPLADLIVSKQAFRVS